MRPSHLPQPTPAGGLTQSPTAKPMLSTPLRASPDTIHHAHRGLGPTTHHPSPIGG